MPRTRQRRASPFGDTTGIPLSPLIDCVFLLLIFFLVTTMLKRKETMIVVAVPDAASSLSAEAREDTLVIGLAEDGRLLLPSGRDPYGAMAFTATPTIEPLLSDERNRSGTRRPVRLEVARATPFQETIDLLDTITAAGFTNVTVKLREPHEATP